MTWCEFFGVIHKSGRSNKYDGLWACLTADSKTSSLSSSNFVLVHLMKWTYGDLFSDIPHSKNKQTKNETHSVNTETCTLLCCNTCKRVGKQSTPGFNNCHSPIFPSKPPPSSWRTDSKKMEWVCVCVCVIYIFCLLYTVKLSFVLNLIVINIFDLFCVFEKWYMENGFVWLVLYLKCTNGHFAQRLVFVPLSLQTVF